MASPSVPGTTIVRSGNSLADSASITVVLVSVGHQSCMALELVWRKHRDQSLYLPRYSLSQRSSFVSSGGPCRGDVS